MKRRLSPSQMSESSCELPEASQHTPTIAHLVKPTTKAAFTLSLRAPFSGGVQIAGEILFILVFSFDLCSTF
ncbi:hypothetical protein EUGRSUZ_J00950 [Eucalyptus grandis]|uniref:Uncharacterized protein n=2 Tax=Eucalyptus grandis TaxID=71139 RepID=A0ACC3J588_EUCGR|nr:hypothetical protein EUGRSUZ_J00950 [Eucalyptus grandis]